MPMMWVPPEIWGVLEQNGTYAPVYYTYDMDEQNWHHFSFDPTETGNPDNNYDIRKYVPESRGLDAEALSGRTLELLQRQLDDGTLSLVACGKSLAPLADAPFYLSAMSTNVDPNYALERDASAREESALVRVSYTMRVSARTYDGCRMDDLIESLSCDLSLEVIKETTVGK